MPIEKKEGIALAIERTWKQKQKFSCFLLTISLLQDHTQYLLMAAIGLELAGAVLFLLDSSLGALLLVCPL